jgi:RsiW-degrading membrane proteinase PrsW (M82 family)
MNPMTARGLGLGVAVAGWTIISHLANLPLQLWPVLVGLGCFLAAGGGISGLQKSALGMLSGVAWVILYVSVSRALGRNEIVDALLLGVAAFGMVLQNRLPLLSFTAGAMAGAGAALGVMGMRAVTFSGGIRVVITLAVGAGLGYAAEWISGMMKTGRS